MQINAVELQGVTRRQGRFRLGPLALTIPAGSIYGLIGPNGAGKTTTLDLIAGIGRADAGTIQVLGRDLARDEVAVKRRIAYAGPEVNYLPWGRVGRLIDFVSGFYPDWDDAKCAELMQAFGLERRASIAGLSFGGIGKLGLVLALSRDPELILLDEPTTGLDPVARRLLYAELLHRMQRPDRTIVMATHLLADLERFADRLAMLENGVVRLQGDMEQLGTRFFQFDLAFAPGTPAPDIPGARLLMQSEGRARFFAEREALAPGWHSTLPGQIIEDRPLSLEELYMAVAGGQARAPEAAAP
jgi:ABC-2 type transport system ATP-binding protein